MVINVAKIKSKIPSYVFTVSRRLNEHGFNVYLVGGSVRDILMGRKPKDYDIGTNALPEDVLSIFPKAVATGAKFGSIKVVIEDESKEAQEVDVTTFRIDEEYVQGRWPSKVTYTRNISEDLSRRDFTINAVALDIILLGKSVTDLSSLIIDPFNGRADIDAKLIRAVGDPYARLSEDALRSLRACRFASVLQFKVDQTVRKAIPSVLPMIDNLSPERVRDEFLKILYNSSKPSVGLNLLKDTGILKIWIPELLEGVGVVQPEFHAHDVYAHALATVDRAEDSVKLAALFHDIGKPRTIIKIKDGIHFYRHDIVGAEMTKEIMQRLRFPSKEIARTTRLVRWHMFYFPYDEKDFLGGKEIRESDLEQNINISKWKDATIRRFVKNVGGEDAIDDLVRLRIADATANPRGRFDANEILALQKRIAEVRKRDMVLKVTDLDIGGEDLKQLGVPVGPEIGKILNELLERVIENPKLNDKQMLIDIVRKEFLK